MFTLLQTPLDQLLLSPAQRADINTLYDDGRSLHSVYSVDPVGQSFGADQREAAALLASDGLDAQAIQDLAGRYNFQWGVTWGTGVNKRKLLLCQWCVPFARGMDLRGADAFFQRLWDGELSTTLA